MITDLTGKPRDVRVHRERLWQSKQTMPLSR